MDIAYDHIQESAFPATTAEDRTISPSGSNDSSDNARKSATQPKSLNEDLQDAYRAFSSSPWGARIGGFLGSVVKQGEAVYREATQELSAVKDDATQGLSSLRQTIINRTRGLSLSTANPFVSTSSSNNDQTSREAGSDDKTPTDETSKQAGTSSSSQEAGSSSQATSVLSRLRDEASKRLRDLQRAEDAADEALLRFGSNLRDFLRDAIQIAPPPSDEELSSGSNSPTTRGPGTVLFESKDAQGKRVIHTSRFDAQLHVIHTTKESFMPDGSASGPEFEEWAKGFDIDKKTEDIAADLAKYPELRATMEALVPHKVPYADFWKRYYFLRHGIETAEARRRDLLRAASHEEEIGWDEDSEDEEEEESETETESGSESGSESEDDKKASAGAGAKKRAGSVTSSTTIQPSAKTAEPRKSNDEKSTTGSEASYDVVGAASGVPSQAPNSPKESRKVDDSSSEEDWE